MNLGFDDDEELLRSTATAFSANELEPFLSRFPEAPLPKPAVLEMLGMVRPFGMLGARLPVEAGGDALTNVQLGILYESFPAEVSMDASTNDLVGFRLYHGGSAELRERYLGPLARAELIAGSAISEPDAGSDLTSISTRVERDGDHWVITGSKTWSSQASVADVLLVAVSLGRDERGRSRVGRILVDTRETPVATRDLDMLGLKRHNMAEVFFDGCRVPAGNMIGQAGDGIGVLSQSWLSQRAHLGLIAVHMADRALRMSLDHAKERRQFGRPIGSFQLVQEMLVEMSVLVDTSRYLCYRALHLIDVGTPSRYASAVAKAQATEAAVKVTSMAIQIHGALGLTCELGLEKLYRDARMLPIPDGTTEIQKLMAGRELLGLNAIRG